MTAPEPWVWLARIRRPQGRKGEVLADILTDFPEKFSERKHLWLIPETGSASPREVGLINYWPHKGGLVLHFAGVDSISSAEALTGLMVAIPQSERAPLSENETYVSDLVGCALIDVAGGAAVQVGVIEDVDRSAGPVPLLVVHGAKGEVLVPFAKEYLRKINLEKKRVEMALPEGLVDLNLTASE
ncbi:MAG TPA: ribosome maturation factor RimM [Terracidiphilus sp.]|nr:ribosome maturation factor RimM [Terracidiphilus sp.]